MSGYVTNLAWRPLETARSYGAGEIVVGSPGQAMTPSEANAFVSQVADAARILVLGAGVVGLGAGVLVGRWSKR